jgi:hypothetical protein
MTQPLCRTHHTEIITYGWKFFVISWFLNHNYFNYC